MTVPATTGPVATTLSASGPSIHLRTWLPAGPPRAIVAICHGFNSHGGQYEQVAALLAERGFVVAAPDLRGRGLSEGPRYYAESIGEYVADLACAIGFVRGEHKDLPVFLIGHSAGGVVACTFALDHGDELAGLICESFAFRVPAPDIALSLIKGISHVAPHFPVLHLKNRDFSRDAAVVEALDHDPLTTNETQPSATVAAMVRAAERLDASFGQITVPLLILHGTADHATRPDGSEQFFREAGSPDKTLKLYDGHFHDLLADLGREEVLTDIIGWIEERLTFSRASAARAS